MPGEPKPIRAFICIQLERGLIAELTELRHRLERTLPGNSVRWNPPDQIHLTLKFLGNIPESQAGDLAAALRGACQGMAPFPLRAEGVGAFPNLRNPRIIWVGLPGEVERLLSLQKQIDSAAQPWNKEAEDRPFRPHLTLARIKSPHASRQIGQALQAAQFVSQHPWRVDQIFLMQSQLSSEGAVHSVLASVSLLDSAHAKDHSP